MQEVDIPSGRVLFEWHSYPEVGLDESYAPPPKESAGAKAAPWDYFHINSIDVEPNGNFLISARNTHGIYELSRRTKKIVWRLGGKKSDFKMGPGTSFAWQHDARRQRDGTITVFDNGAAPPVEKFSRILRLRVDAAAKRLIKDLEPWGVRCQVMELAEASKSRRLTEEEARTWCGLNYAGTGQIKAGDGNLSGDDVREGLTAVISVKLTDTQIEGQTKA